MYPALSRLLASWVPAEERGQLGSLVFAGRYATPYYLPSDIDGTCAVRMY